MNDTQTPTVTDLLPAVVDTLQARTGQTITGALVFIDGACPLVFGTIDAEDLARLLHQVRHTDRLRDTLDGDERREFTHPSVLQGIAEGASWADPRNPVDIDWKERQARALIPFEVDEGGPINPVETTRVWEGRNELGH